MALVSKNFSDIITFTRASTATYFDSTGTLQSAAIDAPRFDYNPSTLAAQGLLIEESRTNSIRNNTMVGAVAGTPGTLPTNWQIVNTAGLSTSVIGSGVEAGVSYVDVRVFGTTTNTIFTIAPELGGTVAATVGQTWTNSSFIKITAGSTANINAIQFGWSEQNSVPAFIDFNVGTVSVSTTGSLASNRRSYSATNIQAATAFIRPAINLAVNNGVAIDITLRIGLPQMELGSFATSVIPTTTTALTRAADDAVINTLSPWYSATAGTLFAEYNIPFALTAGTGPRLASLQGAGGPAVDELPLFIVQISGKAASVNAFTAGVNAGRVDATASFATNTTTKAAYAYALNDRSVTTGGSVPTTSAAVYTIPTVTLMRLGTQGSGISQINGYLRRVSFFPRRLSNAELQALTT